MKEKTNYQEKQLNAFTMWGSAGNGKTVFARQITGDIIGEMNRLDGNRVFIPVILVGFDGEMGIDVGELLEENKALKAQIEDQRKIDHNYVERTMSNILNRLGRVEEKKWYQFWK